MKLRIIENGEERIHELMEHETLLTIGRTKDCDIVLSENKSSRRHCQIRKTDDGYFIKDLDSSNGTIVNEEKVKDSKLNLGDKIMVGKTVIYFGEPVPVKITPIPSSFTKPKNILTDDRKADSLKMIPKNSVYGLLRNIAITVGVIFVGFILAVVVMQMDLTSPDDNESKSVNEPKKKTPVVEKEDEASDKITFEDRQRKLAFRAFDQILLSETSVFSMEKQIKDLLKRKERASYYSELYSKYETFLKNITDYLIEELERIAYTAIEYIKLGNFTEMLSIYDSYRNNYKTEPIYRFNEIKVELYEKIDYLTDSANEFFYNEIVSQANEQIDSQNWDAAKQVYIDAKSLFVGFDNIQILCNDMAEMIDNYLDVIKNGKYEKIPDEMVSRIKEKTQKPKGLDKKKEPIKPSEKKISEDDMLTTLRQKLIDSINRKNSNYMISKIIYLQPGDKSTKFIIKSADKFNIYDRKGNSLAWTQIASWLINELNWRIKKKDMQTLWGMTTYAYKEGLTKQAGEILAEIYRDDKELKSEIDKFMSKHLKRSIPEGGFIYHRVSGDRDRIITPEEMQVIENKKQIKKLMRQLKKDFKTLLRQSKEEKLQKANAETKETLTAMINLGADEEIPEIINIIRDTMTEMAKKARTGRGHITPALKQKLEAARAEALGRINDKVRYPDANHGARDANGEHGQPWVDEAVNKLGEIWEDPQFGRIDILLSKILSMFKEFIDIVDANSRYHNPEEDQKIMDEVSRQLEDDKILRDNASAGPSYCTPNEKAHVRIVNDYRIMLGRSPLRINSQLCTASRRHSEYMKASGKFAHS
ncbi:MAG: FHA domain-containing protein, partial [Planctomycetes bacterium]|nr:FHA domain-containing protein [Planctomycetota bacterium]